MRPPPPPEEITELMQFIAEKAKNVTSPMNVLELCKQFKAESGSLLSMGGLISRIRLHRLRIHEISELDMDTKVKMMFALSAPIDARFLIEMRKVADIEVDDQQRIIQYKQKDGGLELSAENLQLSMNQGEKRNGEILQFLTKKSETTDSPMPDRLFSREFKETTGCSDSIESIEQRYRRVKEAIYQSIEIDKNARIKMMFISNVKLSDDILKELREDADVEVDYKGRITKYKSTDGSLDLGESYEMSSIQKTVYPDRWRTVCEKITNVVSEKDNENEYQRKRIDLVRFLIERTKNATSPLNISQLAKDYKAEFRNPEPPQNTVHRIRSFRQRIHGMNQFDNPTKVRLAFALSAAIDADFLKELQKDAFVELDKEGRIEKYKAKDGSLEVEGDHSGWAKRKATWANEIRIVNHSSEPIGEKYAQSTRLSQSPAALQKGRKRKRVSYYFPEVSVEKDEDEESMKLVDDWTMDFDANNAEDFDYDPSKYELDMDHLPVEKKPESLLEVKTEESSTTIVGNHFEKNFFAYDRLNDVEHIPEEKKPESLLEVKIEIPEQPSTSNLEYYYEEDVEHILMAPKQEFIE